MMSLLWVTRICRYSSVNGISRSITRNVQEEHRLKSRKQQDQTQTKSQIARNNVGVKEYSLTPYHSLHYCTEHPCGIRYLILKRINCNWKSAKKNNVAHILRILDHIYSGPSGDYWNNSNTPLD